MWQQIATWLRGLDLGDRVQRVEVPHNFRLLAQEEIA